MKRPIAHRALAGLAFALLALTGCSPTAGDDPDATTSAPNTPTLIPAPAALQTRGSVTE